MITTIQEQLDSKNIPLDSTVFAASSHELLNFPISTAPFLEWQQRTQHMALVQKNRAEAMPLEAAEGALNVSFADLPREMPWFCNGLDALRSAREEGRPIAVVGGPCLFGTDEVHVEVTTDAGESCLFDYSTGRCCEGQSDQVLKDYLSGNAQHVVVLTFHNLKRGITSQERDSILWLFVVARQLDAEIVLPLPDMSYIKYLTAITALLPEQVAQKAKQEFSVIAHNIAEMYICMTRDIARMYPGVSYTILHDCDTALCERYYEMREPALNRHKVLRNLTGIPEKFESIKDYISMLALPYYLHGIRDILQVDSLDELDSYRKCCKMHKNTLNLACMLYPERLSADGVNTIFQTTQAYKEYL